MNGLFILVDAVATEQDNSAAEDWKPSIYKVICADGTPEPCPLEEAEP